MLMLRSWEEITNGIWGLIKRIENSRKRELRIFI
jgi:hypothetical protein